MILLLDIGNTHTHAGLADRRRIHRCKDFPTAAWSDGSMAERLRKFVGRPPLLAAAFCSVVPAASQACRLWLASQVPLPTLELTHKTLRGVGIDYPKPASIGPDRLANAAAVHHYHGHPALVVDFGTAVTFDVVDRRGNYAGGIIAPGLAAMTDYLHERTALLPRIRIREVEAVVGKNTREAMLIGAVHGYRGLVRELIHEVRAELGGGRLPVVATGGYAALIAAKLKEITDVNPNLTLEGLRLNWLAHEQERAPKKRDGQTPRNRRN